MDDPQIVDLREVSLQCTSMLPMFATRRHSSWVRRLLERAWQQGVNFSESLSLRDLSKKLVHFAISIIILYYYNSLVFLVQSQSNCLLLNLLQVVEHQGEKRFS